MNSMLVAVLALAAFGAASAQTTTAAIDQNSWSFMLNRDASCATRYQTLVEDPFYANDLICKTQVKRALETYVKTDCPSTTAPSSTVWRCMSGYNATSGQVDQNRIDAWTTFLKGCEVLYIAQRVNTAESEDGFQWRDNSCFGRFKSMDEFVAYLKNTQGGDGGSAGSVFVSALNVVLALALALFLLR
ncbi:hypothetical protein CHLRE_01g010400v5 [Chlamydomonas reinhardtii]|jgi:hypothetical protein|uniref:Uncharacterized protein n=1 Tax=Chlamydomonas reinhardtii TaxID=3055 RepID=A8HP72_CHLRE|nr:uncharacterized protein CHLRE_01g010400v5 [Chlamydomonas reinhardtii]PNW88004.1 hypothetical protein CHLRE_01g010400v5 [Chlamydomonas reinhardtii]|eukprot:XP_001689865.1 predicted protein [Chlamydomonas reinhardtii]